jgi:hypothetical protein
MIKLLATFFVNLVVGLFKDWRRDNSLKQEGANEQAIKSVASAEKDEQAAHEAARAVDADIASGRVSATAPDRFTRTD